MNTDNPLVIEDEEEKAVLLAAAEEGPEWFHLCPTGCVSPMLIDAEKRLIDKMQSCGMLEERPQITLGYLYLSPSGKERLLRSGVFARAKAERQAADEHERLAWHHDAIIRRLEEGNGKDAVQTRIAGNAYDLTSGLSREDLAFLYEMDTDRRGRVARNIVRNVARNTCQAVGQLYALCLLQAVNAEFMKRPYMDTFTEKLREKLVGRVAQFRCGAFALTDAEFDAAVEKAW